MPHYKTDDLLEKSLELIEQHKLFFITDVITLLGMSSSTFYVHFPSNSEKYAQIADAIEKQRVAVKVAMRSRWFKSDNASLQMGLMKLISTPEERAALSHQHNENINQHSGEIKITREIIG